MPTGWVGTVVQCAQCGGDFKLKSKHDQRFCSRQCATAGRVMPAVRKPYRRRPLEERFWEKVQRGGSTECWPWTGARDKHGYGRIQRGGRGGGLVKAHRVSYELEHGPLDDDQVIRHRCDNPPCVNPAHLVPGTMADNSADMVERQRSTAGRPRFERRIYTDAEIRELRSRVAVGGDWRELASAIGMTEKYASAVLTGERRRLAGGPLTRRYANFRSDRKPR